MSLCQGLRCKNAKSIFLAFSAKLTNDRRMRMARISREVLKNIISKNPTSKELDFLIYIAQFIGSDGVCRGIYYKDVMRGINCCKQTFYSVKKSLQEKGIITIESESDIDYDITIINNPAEFRDKESYLYVRKGILHQPAFMELSAGAKMIALDLIMICDTNKGKWKISKANFKRRYVEQLSPEGEELFILPFKIKARTARDYLKELAELFYINHKDNNISFRVKEYERSFDDKDIKLHQSDNDVWSRHFVRAIFKRLHFHFFTGKQERDIAGLLIQYFNRARDVGKNICSLLQDAVIESLALDGYKANAPSIHMRLKALLTG